MSSVLPYQYQSLQPGDIRLLQLLPVSPDDVDRIRFHIVHVSIERCDVPDSFFSYEALSYVWGGDRTEQVYCEDRAIMVTPNLASALYTLRENMPFLGFQRTLWVDAICINQDDIIERGHQVRLMRDIYSHAAAVLIWIGSSRSVIENLLRIKRGHLPGDELQDGLGGAYLRNEYFRNWGKGVRKIWNAAWFQRVWVIQEVVFANKAYVLGGDVSIEWEQLVVAALATRESPDVKVSYKLRCTAVLGMDCLRNQIHKEEGLESALQLGTPGSHLSARYQELIRSVRSGTFSLQPKDLLELAQLFRPYASTDPRDKIYAILGLASALETDRLASRIDANYDLLVPDLFLSFSRHVISLPAPLRLLQVVDGAREPPSDLPSWVPDWTIPLKIRPLGEILGPNYLYPDERPNILKHANPKVLKLIGKRVDTIKAVSEPLSLELPVLPQKERLKLKGWKSWLSLGIASGSIPAGGFNWSAFLVPDAIEICSGRRSMLTKEFRCGLVPPKARVGDQIVLFPGAQTLFLVRKHENNDMFSLVGDCYMDNFAPKDRIHTRRHNQREFCLR